jgi:hypothetical protein
LSRQEPARTVGHDQSSAAIDGEVESAVGAAEGLAELGMVEDGDGRTG